MRFNVVSSDNKEQLRFATRGVAIMKGASNMKRLLVIVLVFCLIVPMVMVQNTNADVKSIKVIPYPKKAGKMASYHISFNVNRELEANKDSITVTLPQETLVPEFVSSSVISVNPQKLIGADYKLTYETGDIDFTDPLREGDMIRASYTYEASPDYTMMPIQSNVKFFDRTFDYLRLSTDPSDPRSNNGQFDPGEWVYEDRDSDGRISPGDRRLMVIHGVLGGDSTVDPFTLGSDAKQNSIVAPGDLDCNNCTGGGVGVPTPLNPLVPLSLVRLVMLDVNHDGIYNEGDYLLDDRDMSDTVTQNDLMITGIVHYPPNSIVSFNDPDYRDRMENLEGGMVTVPPLQIYSFDQTTNTTPAYVWRHADDGPTIGKYDPGEAIYRDGYDATLPFPPGPDPTGGPSTYSVDAGDTRATSITVIQSGITFFYPAGSVVDQTDKDVGTRLISFQTATGEEEGFLDVNQSQGVGYFDPGEPIYRNNNGRAGFLYDVATGGVQINAMPQPGDVRLSAYAISAYAQGSVVQTTHADNGNQLVDFNKAPTQTPELMVVDIEGQTDFFPVPQRFPMEMTSNTLFAGYAGGQFTPAYDGSSNATSPNPTQITNKYYYNRSRGSSTSDDNYVFGSWLYRDNDQSGSVTVNDTRLTEVNIAVGQQHVIYSAGSTVKDGELDVRSISTPQGPLMLAEPALCNTGTGIDGMAVDASNNPAPVFAEQYFEIKHTENIAVNNKFDPGEFLYLDLTPASGGVIGDGVVDGSINGPGASGPVLDQSDCRLVPVGVTSFGNKPISTNFPLIGSTLTKGWARIENKVIVPYATAGTTTAKLDKTDVKILPTLEPPMPPSYLSASTLTIPGGNTPLSGSGEWWIKVTAINEYGEGEFSESIKINFVSGQAQNAVKIDWTPVPYAKSYKIYKSRNETYFPHSALLAEVKAPITEYIDRGTTITEGTLPYPYKASFVTLWRSRSGVESELVEFKCADYEINLDTGMISFRRDLKPYEIVLANYKYAEDKSQTSVSGDPCDTVGHQDENVYIDVQHGTGKLLHAPAVDPTIDPLHYCFRLWRAPTIDPNNPYLLRPGVDYTIDYETGEIKFSSHVITEGDIITVDYDSYEEVMGESLVEAVSTGVNTARCQAPVLPESYTISKAVALTSSPQIKITSGANGHQLIFTTPVDIFVDPDNDQSTPDVVMTLNRPGRQFNTYDKGAVRNPQVAGSYQLWVSTSQEQTPILSEPYEITADTTSENMKLKVISPQVPEQADTDPACDCKEAAGTSGQVMSLAVQLTDGSNGIQGVYVRFAIEDTVSPPSTFSSADLVQTNDQGLASVVLNMSATPGVTRVKVYLQDDPSICRCVEINTGPPVEVSSIVLTPGPTLALSPGTMQQFTAKAFKANGAQITGVEFTWAADCGTISQAGVYTAPLDAGGTCHVYARAHGVEGQTTVSIVSRPSRITVTPPSAIVATGSQKQFTAQAYDDMGNPMNIPITWTIEPAGLGSFASDGTFTAGNISGTGTVKACSAGVCGTATVTVQSTGNISSLVVSPDKATMKIGQTQQFTAKVLDTNGFEITGANVTWTVNPSTMGTISSNGLFIASSPGTAIIIAQSGAVTGMAIVNVVEIARIELNPTGTVTVPTGKTQTFTAVAYNTAGAAIPGMDFTWTLSPTSVGVLSPSGSTAIFTATGMTGQSGVVMVQAAGLSATTQVVIGALDTTKPTVTASADSGIKNGETTLAGTGQIKVAVSDPEGIASVTVNGIPATPDGTGNWVATVNVNNGQNQFVVKAIDNNGNETTETITAYGSSMKEMILNIDTTQPYGTLILNGVPTTVGLTSVPEIGYGTGSTFVGLRDLGEQLFGGTVDYEAATKKITITIPRSNGDKDILVTVVGQKDFRITTYKANGTQEVKDYTLTYAPYIGSSATQSKSYNYDRTLVPMRELVQAVVNSQTSGTNLPVPGATENSVDFNSTTRDATFRFLP